MECYSPFLENYLADASFDQSSDLINMDYAPICSSEFPSSMFSSDEFSGFSEITSYPDGDLFTAVDDLMTSQMVEEASMEIEECDADLMIEGFFGNYNNALEGSEGMSFPSEQACSHQFSSEGNDVWSPSSLVTTSEASSMDSASFHSPLNFPREEERVENQLSIRHLLHASAEAKECGQKELEDVILRCISEKVSPFGESLERVAFNLCRESADDEQQQGGDYLKQESLKNSKAALKVFIQQFPYARFAHYVANSAILEAIPLEAAAVHIVDFYMGEGLQLAQIIEALAQRFKTLKVTAIKWEDEDGDETKKNLQNHASSFGLNLKLEEVALDDLVTKIKMTMKRNGAKEFLVFNCMNSLPHMRARRSTRHVMEYVRLAKEILASSGNSNKGTKSGIITFTDSDARLNLGNSSSFGNFFDENVAHYQALMDSMELSFPSHLADARMAMESIFVAPNVSSKAWFENWTEMKGCHDQPFFGLEGRRLSQENLTEAREIVGHESSYGIRNGGENGNEIVLEFRGTPLVRVSTWEE